LTSFLEDSSAVEPELELVVLAELEELAVLQVFLAVLVVPLEELELMLVALVHYSVASRVARPMATPLLELELELELQREMPVPLALETQMPLLV
jgi:hypothetical protein